MLYNKFSDYLKNKYGEKVYKLPLNMPVSCPNRDGKLGFSGCIFCGEEGAGFELLSNCIPIHEQVEENMKYIKKKYNANKFIAYFQNYSNTYIEFEKFKKYINDSCAQWIVAIYLSTRPDCIHQEYLEFLKDLSEKTGIDIVIELGLQTVNYHTLKFLNRGHGLSEFIKAVIEIKKYNIDICVHYITDLPMDNMDDVIEGAKILSAIGVNQVKCHSLYILKDTKMGEMYEKGDLKPISINEFIERTIEFIENLSPDITIQRLIGRAPKERSLFCNWDTSWWKIQEMIENKMILENRSQGAKIKDI